MSVTRSASLLLIFLTLKAGLGASFVPRPQQLKDYLPSEKESRRWKADGLPQEFLGEDLFLYMDGGASIYQEYGFRRLLVQDYRDTRSKPFSLEIFEMAGPESAYGAYTFKTSAGGRRIALGNEGCVEDYYLNAWKGRYLVTLTGNEPDTELVQGLIEIAKVVTDKIAPGGAAPEIINLLPVQGLIRASQKYFRGPLGLFNVYPFLTPDVFGPKEGIRGDYSSGHSVCILNYQSSRECSERIGLGIRTIERSSKYKRLRGSENNVYLFKDHRGDTHGLTCFESYILAVSGNLAPMETEELLLRVQKRIQERPPLEISH